MLGAMKAGKKEEASKTGSARGVLPAKQRRCHRGASASGSLLRKFYCPTCLFKSRLKNMHKADAAQNEQGTRAHELP
jgi:hypothetical protein